MNYLNCESMGIFSTQVLDQVTLKPGDVSMNCAVLFGAKNRSMNYLPGRPELYRVE